MNLFTVTCTDYLREVAMTLDSDFEPQFSGFHDLMKFRVREILLVSSLYDAFVLEEDGRLSERIFSEYVDLNLRFIPRMTRVSTAEEALRMLRMRTFDLVITMTRITDMNPIEFGKKVKELDPLKPVILLTFESISPEQMERIHRTHYIDKVFYWSGDTKILLAIIKFVEDLGNVTADVQAGVQVILIIEDNPRFYSMFLALIYAEIMTQTRTLISEGVNDLHRLLRMRARPKILLAQTYEEGMEIYENYKQNLLGIISDVRYPRRGQLDAEAGLKLMNKVKSEVPDLPILLQSNETDLQRMSNINDAFFLNKNSQNLLLELRSFILTNLGFGDFIFRYPDGREIGRARNLQELEKMIRLIPGDSLLYHARRNHISIWLRARTEFELADDLRPKKVSDFQNTDELRQYIAGAISKLIHRNQFGVITDFHAPQSGFENAFIRLGNGSLGGKGRSIAFVNAILAKTDILEKHENIKMRIPHTFTICTEVFEDFLEMNDLHKFAVTTYDDNRIAQKFLECKLPDYLSKDLKTLLEKVQYPLAVRSSSVLEDSQNLPFAGLYSTYMIPNNHPDLQFRLSQLSDAIKLVYASVFYKAPKEYVRNTDYRIEEEKMAVLIQELAGQFHDDVYYPVISGVAQSYNYYPTAHLNSDDGIVHLALGLGKTIVDGEKIYRFSPAYPEMNPPFSSAEEYLKKSQSSFYALDLKNNYRHMINDENFGLLKLDLSQAESDGTLFFVGSSYSSYDRSIKDDLSIKGPRVVTFANILKYKIFPLAEILRDWMDAGRKAMGTHVEIEFALNLYRNNIQNPELYILQIRPMVAGNESGEVSLDDNNMEETCCRSAHALGNGFFQDIYDIVYLKPANFEVSKTQQIAAEIDQINQRFIEEKRNYVLIGFGRWGTSDPWLGIPVKWDQVSQAKVIIESNLARFKVDPSDGSHFFHNLVSLRLGYFHINSSSTDEFISWDWIEKQPSLRETEYIRHIRFDQPISVKIDGRTSKGAIFKPVSSNEAVPQ